MTRPERSRRERARIEHIPRPKMRRTAEKPTKLHFGYRDGEWTAVEDPNLLDEQPRARRETPRKPNREHGGKK